MACDTYQRDRCVAAEMEACWKPINSAGASLPGYDPHNDPFCPLAVARRFNQMQREASIGGTQSLIDLRTPSASFSKKTTGLEHSSRRPRSSGGRMTDSGVGVCRAGAGERQTVLPCVAGASLQVREGGGFTAIRQPPLRAAHGNGLPSFSKVNEGLIRRRAKKHQLVSKTTRRTSVSERHGSGGTGEGRDPTAAAELSAGAREDFAVKVARRDDILQDLWLKMHSAEGFATVQGSNELARLLRLYRSASLDLIEDIMRHPELEKVADAHTRKKGEGMRSYREAVAQDADFADGIPEAASWLGFLARRNPLFLPPKSAGSDDEHLVAIGIDDAGNDGDLLSRMRDAQAFILLEKNHARADRGGEACGVEKEVAEFAPGGRGDSAANVFARKSVPPGGDGRGGPRGSRLRGRVRMLNTQLAGAQETIRSLEENLRVLEAERERDTERAARVREAAAEAGRRKMTQRMFRLRGDAAVLEEGIEELDGDVTAFRVRLFAERLDVSRKRMLKDALTAEMATKSRTRTRKAKKLNVSQTHGNDEDKDDENECRRQRDASAATIQARVRSMQSRRPKEGQPGAGHGKSSSGGGTTTTAGVQGKIDVHTLTGHEGEAAAVCIGAAVRGHLTRRRLSGEEAEPGAFQSASPAEAPSNDVADVENEKGGIKASNTGATVAAEAQLVASPHPRRSLPSAYVMDNLAQLEALGVVGVRAFLESLGLGAYADRLPVNPDAELRSAGVSARLHRVKLMSALGVSVGPGVAPIAATSRVLPSSSALDAATYTPARDGGCEGSAAATPIATIAALQMVRQLRRELMPRESEHGLSVGGESGFDGPARTVATPAIARDEGASLVPVLLPELEKVLSTQLHLQSQV
ncbi:unnamed protein product, partial [Scytosiphon promiscuus]